VPCSLLVASVASLAAVVFLGAIECESHRDISTVEEYAVELLDRYLCDGWICCLDEAEAAGALQLLVHDDVRALDVEVFEKLAKTFVGAEIIGHVAHIEAFHRRLQPEDYSRLAYTCARVYSYVPLPGRGDMMRKKLLI